MRFILAFLALACASALQAKAPAGSIDEFVTAEMPKSGAPGLAYAVVEDRSVRSGAVGEMIVGSGRDISPETPFVIGSISKSFTAVAVMQLVEADLIELGDPISKFLNEFSDRPSGSITIRQLLSHTSGFSTVQGNDAHTEADRPAGTLSEQVDRIAQWNPAYEPGTTWEYSNANYQVLGRLIEAVSGQDFARYMETKVLEPIGMTHSFVADGGTYEDIATGHRPWFGGKRALETNETDVLFAPAGGVIASANDLARYMAMMMNGEDDVISAETKAAMMRPASEASPFYGLGWFINSDNGTVWHSGSTPGVETLATLMPSERKAAVVLVNAGSGIGFGETAGLRNGITARALGLAYEGEGSRVQQKGLFVAMTLLPLFFLGSMAWAWRFRAELRPKTGNVFGLFSLWFPLAVTLTMAWAFVYLIPPLFAGGSMGTLQLFQPDLALTMIATMATGVVWAVFRLCLAYSRRGAA